MHAAVDDVALSRLHALAFGGAHRHQPWDRRLHAHSLSWICAHDAHDVLVGFVNIAWDGGAPAFLLDCLVHPDAQRTGLGSALVRTASEEATEITVCVAGTRSPRPSDDDRADHPAVIVGRVARLRSGRPYDGARVDHAAVIVGRVATRPTGRGTSGRRRDRRRGVHVRLL